MCSFFLISFEKFVGSVKENVLFKIVWMILNLSFLFVFCSFSKKILFSELSISFVHRSFFSEPQPFPRYISFVQKYKFLHQMVANKFTGSEIKTLDLRADIKINYWSPLLINFKIARAPNERTLIGCKPAGISKR